MRHIKLKFYHMIDTLNWERRALLKRFSAFLVNELRLGELFPLLYSSYFVAMGNKAAVTMGSLCYKVYQTLNELEFKFFSRTSLVYM